MSIRLQEPVERRQHLQTSADPSPSHGDIVTMAARETDAAKKDQIDNVRLKSGERCTKGDNITSGSERGTGRAYTKPDNIRDRGDIITSTLALAARHLLGSDRALPDLIDLRHRHRDRIRAAEETLTLSQARQVVTQAQAHLRAIRLGRHDVQRVQRATGNGESAFLLALSIMERELAVALAALPAPRHARASRLVEVPNVMRLLAQDAAELVEKWCGAGAVSGSDAGKLADLCRVIDGRVRAQGLTASVRQVGRNWARSGASRFSLPTT